MGFLAIIFSKLTISRFTKIKESQFKNSKFQAEIQFTTMFSNRVFLAVALWILVLYSSADAIVGYQK
jgi:hypothetical protein